ncbi:increased recombination centers protein 6 [Scheffersomyces coipomensis]|uniref:increased recombination centers protein 6 n=1 Tax=Scheffersomyces coipomensis TaxID=1788519 RepID=UPI00315D2620
MIPNHILILGPSYSSKVQIANLIAKKDEKSNEEQEQNDKIIKTSITTKYYSLDLNIFIDEYFETRKSHPLSDREKLDALIKWSDEFLSEECVDLREVLDGFIFCVSFSEDSVDYISKGINIIDTIRSKLVDNDKFEGFFTIIGSNYHSDSDVNESIEDLIISSGYEYINFDISGKNEYDETIGKDRIIELIESNEWTHMNLIKHNDYENSKMQKLNDMTKGLLSQDDNDDGDENNNA